MRLRFLGTGTSYGVPYLGCTCAVCTSSDPRDKRLRASIVVESGETRLLVDTGPDFRQQCLRADIMTLDAILWTHAHNDHIIGLDDIRPFSDRAGYLAGYADAKTGERLLNIFHYCFVPGRDHPGFPRATLNLIEPFQKLRFDAISVTPLPISHGRAGEILAYEFEENGQRAVYASDCVGIPDASLQKMKGCDVFIVDALRQAEHPNHFSVAQALEASREIGAKCTFFTHITHELGHAETEAALPDGVKVAFDGLELEI
jgi:phosphoribosyl 1,2-cyclic phosphate phosphodiesterase